MPLITKEADGNYQTAPLFDDSHDSRMSRNRVLPPKGPKSFRVQKAGTGIRVIIDNWPEDQRSGTTQFLIYWAEDVDETTADGVTAGFARATLLSPAIALAGRRRPSGAAVNVTQSIGFYNDPKYQVGFFYCVGVNADGLQSDSGIPVNIGTGNGGTTPNDVEHFQASESGEQHDGSTISVVSYSFMVPQGGGPLERVQFMFQNYPSLNSFSEGESVRVTVGRGGTQSGQLKFPIARRMGTGTITIAGTAVTTPAGTGNFLAIAAMAGGDQLEVLGVQARILSVTDNDTATLVGAWTGPTVTAFTGGWQVIGAVKLYAVSEGKNGARRDDPENSPFVLLDLDGLLSAPIAPTIAAVTQGNDIRIDLTPVYGTEIVGYEIYRGTGVTTFAFCGPVQPLTADPTNSTGTLQWIDKDFSTFEREQGQVFTYFATAVNSRGTPSVPSAGVTAACRLDAPADNSPIIPTNAETKNLIFNSYIYGTPANTVAIADASQDTWQGAAPAGYQRWDSFATGANFPGHQNNTEVIIPAPSDGAAGIVQIMQSVGAWDTTVNNPVANHRVDMGRNLTFSVYLSSTSPVAPNGYMELQIRMQNNIGTDVGYYKPKVRLADDLIDYETYALMNNYSYRIDGSRLTEVGQFIYAVFSPQIIPASVAFVNFVIRHCATTNGNNLIVTKVKVNYGDQPAAWSPDLVGVTFPKPGGTPPGAFKDRDGSGGGGRIPLQP